MAEVKSLPAVNLQPALGMSTNCAAALPIAAAVAHALFGSKHKGSVHLWAAVARFAAVKHEAIQRRVPDKRSALMPRVQRRHWYRSPTVRFAHQHAPLAPQPVEQN
jgi:hypothetical protein